MSFAFEKTFRISLSFDISHHEGVLVGGPIVCSVLVRVLIIFPNETRWPREAPSLYTFITNSLSLRLSADGFGMSGQI